MHVWLYQLASALQIVHEARILHRDVKAANVLLLSNGDAKLTDLGLASNRLSKLPLTIAALASLKRHGVRVLHTCADTAPASQAATMPGKSLSARGRLPAAPRLAASAAAPPPRAAWSRARAS